MACHGVRKMNIRKSGFAERVILPMEYNPFLEFILYISEKGDKTSGIPPFPKIKKVVI